MKIIIDISEKMYKDIQSRDWKNGAKWFSEEWKVIRNGTPLDKHDEEVIAETVESIWGKPPYRDMLDKIRDEIMQLYNEVEVVDYDHNDISRIKKAHWIIREEVLWIIDKYNSHPKRGQDMREGD